jgi:hypothetical protein
MATANGILLALTGILFAFQAAAASAGRCDGEALDTLALEISRRRQASKASKA